MLGRFIAREPVEGAVWYLLPPSQDRIEAAAHFRFLCGGGLSTHPLPPIAIPPVPTATCEV